ncbi:MAG: alpha-2-macroglobulin family protein, partial [Synechococcales cyanobacterium]
AVLQLTGYRPPDLVKTVYAEQPVTVRFVDNRPDVVLQPLSSPLKKGWGYGGGLSMGLGDTQVRRDFHPVAFFKGSTVTSQNGEAQFSFRLPDDLTTWRVMVVAADTQNFGKLRKDGSPLSPVD